MDDPPTLRTFPPPLPSDSSASYDTKEVESGLSESSHLLQASTTGSFSLKRLGRHPI
jgi:hypothetical protein